MTAEEILKGVFSKSNFAEYPYNDTYEATIEAMQEYAKIKCQELLEIVADKAEPTDFGYAVSRYSIMNAVDLENFCS